MTEDEVVGCHHWLSGHEFEGTMGVGDGQGSLACCRGWKESDMTEQLNWTEWDILVFFPHLELVRTENQIERWQIKIPSFYDRVSAWTPEPGQAAPCSLYNRVDRRPKGHVSAGRQMPEGERKKRRCATFFSQTHLLSVVKEGRTDSLWVLYSRARFLNCGTTDIWGRGLFITGASSGHPRMFCWPLLTGYHPTTS